MRAFGFVEAEGAGERFEHAVGDAVHVAALDAGVVGGADAGQDGDLLAAQTGDASGPVGGKPRLLGGDPRPAGGQELLDLASRIHLTNSLDLVRGARVTLSVPLSAGT